MQDKNELGFKILVRIKTKNIPEETILDELMGSMQIEKCQGL